MALVKEIRDYFNKIYPFYMKLDFDNVGMLVGFCDKEVDKVLVALDITDEVIDEAVERGAQLIVSHHPLLFDAIKKVTDDDSKGRKIIKMVTNGISAICLHTNLDTAKGGVNDALIKALGAENDGIFVSHGEHPNGEKYGISRLGHLTGPVALDKYLDKVKKALNCNGLRYHDAGRPVFKIACCGGAGAGDMQAALAEGCDTYVTADVKYDHFLWAKENGMNLIDADHYCTENVVVPILKEALQTEFPELQVTVSRIHEQTAKFF